MKLQTKIGLGILVVFSILAVSLSVASVAWVNQNTIREAEQRVKLYIQSSWEIYNDKLARMQSAVEILAQEQQVRALLKDTDNPALMQTVLTTLEINRKQQSMDVMTLLDASGRVILRTRPPYTRSDSPTDPVIDHVVRTRKSTSGTVILSGERLEAEGEGLLDQCLRSGGEPQGMMMIAVAPVIVDDELIGMLETGNLLNGAADKVDRIRDTVFRNEQYGGKPVGTATIFMGDLRISTNVVNNQGERAVGTRASREVAEQVLKNGLPWTGPAWVVDTWYLSQYDPVRDPEGQVIGMLYVGELEQKYIDMGLQALALYLAVILAGMLLAFLVFYLILRGILRPIHRLSVATLQLSGGDLSYRVRVSSKDEIGELGKSFNEMAAQLEKQRQEIERHRQELETLNAELRATNRNYMEMLGFVVHELKNPLASSILNVHTVKDGLVGELNATQKEALEAVARSLGHFNNMIKDYLDLSRLEKGELIVHKSRVRLCAEVVEPVVGGLARGMQERRMVVENHITRELEFEADRDLLRIVYDNLLANAIKYGREGGKITLDAAEHDSVVHLAVTNEGDGIPADKLPQLFKKFSRLDVPAHRGKKGTGLGLYICNEILEKHGGSIQAESKEGEWVRFSITLPKNGTAHSS